MLFINGRCVAPPTNKLPELPGLHRKPELRSLELSLKTHYPSGTVSLPSTRPPSRMNSIVNLSRASSVSRGLTTSKLDLYNRDKPKRVRFNFHISRAYSLPTLYSAADFYSAPRTDGEKLQKLKTQHWEEKRLERQERSYLRMIDEPVPRKLIALSRFDRTCSPVPDTIFE